MPSERLSKVISQSGLASRRKCDYLIESGHVKVNNIIILQPYFRVNIEHDIITINDFSVNLHYQPTYIALYKPKNYISDLISQDERLIARNLIPIDMYLFPIGRLDYNSEGLMIFSNDGGLANKIMHPRFGTEKEYLVKFKGTIEEPVLKEIKNGLLIDGISYKVDMIKFIRKSLSNSWYRIILKEGKNRMIRKIGNKIKHPVLKLTRVRIGPIKIGKLKPGQYRYLTEREINELTKINS